MNALKHGLTAQIVVMPSEDPEVYQLHLMSFNDEYKPKGATEANLVQALADTAWRQNRLVALETDVLTERLNTEAQMKAVVNLSLHGQRLSRQFDNTAKELRALQESRRVQERSEMDTLLNIFETKGDTYNPSSDGFVFSAAEIAAARRLRHRERLGQKSV